jgi:AraC-like DNA-binding protein
MIDAIYIGLTIALASALFVLGFLFLSLCNANESPVFRTALRIMLFTYCFFGLVNLLELWSRTFMPDTDDTLLLRIIVLIVAVSQACLFTYALVLLLRAAYFTRKRIICELVPIATLSVALVISRILLPVIWVEIAVRLFTLFYISLLVKYTWIFIIIYRRCLRKLDNFFSGREAEHLRWVRFSFVAALSIGLLALATSFFPDIHLYIVCTVIYLFFYLYFAFRFIHYGFVYKKLEEALLREDIRREEDRNLLHHSIVRSIETCLKIWIDEKMFLQPDVTIDTVARYVGKNSKYLSVYLNQYLNRTFREWVNELRIEESKNLLRQYPERTVVEISRKAGFVNSSHFGRQFRRLTHCTPNEWRKNYV